jgi:hypothetical protein
VTRKRFHSLPTCTIFLLWLQAYECTTDSVPRETSQKLLSVLPSCRETSPYLRSTKDIYLFYLTYETQFLIGTARPLPRYSLPDPNIFGYGLVYEDTTDWVPRDLSIARVSSVLTCQTTLVSIQSQSWNANTMKNTESTASTSCYHGDRGVAFPRQYIRCSRLQKGPCRLKHIGAFQGVGSTMTNRSTASIQSRTSLWKRHTMGTGRGFPNQWRCSRNYRKKSLPTIQGHGFSDDEYQKAPLLKSRIAMETSCYHGDQGSNFPVNGCSGNCRKVLTDSNYRGLQGRWLYDGPDTESTASMLKSRTSLWKRHVAMGSGAWLFPVNGGSGNYRNVTCRLKRYGVKRRTAA